MPKVANLKLLPGYCASHGISTNNIVIVKIPGTKLHFHMEGSSSLSVALNKNKSGGRANEHHDIYSISVIGGQFKVSRKTGKYHDDVASKIQNQLNTWLAK